VRVLRAQALHLGDVIIALVFMLLVVVIQLLARL
jgi:hypothetical protein